MFNIFFVENLPLKLEVCGSRDLFVLENCIIQLFRGISLSMPHEVNLTGINMFKRHIVKFSKNLENNFFFLKKMRKKSTS